MTARAGDAELRIVFNAEEKTFLIDGVLDRNNILESSFGYEEGSVKGRDFRSILPESVNQAIDDYLEIEEENCNIVSILSRTRNFALLSEEGESVQVGMRIIPDVSMDRLPRYRMVVRDSAEAGSGLFKAIDVVGQYEVLDADLGISTEEFFYKKADIVCDYISQKGTKATLALIQIDKYDGLATVFGQGTCKGVLQEVVARCRSSFRDADVVGYFGGGKVGVLLLESGADTARIPLNRLRGYIAHQPMFSGENQSVKATVSVAFSQITAEDQDVPSLAKRCVESLAETLDKTDVLIEI